MVRLFTIKLTFSASLPRGSVTVSVNIQKKLKLTPGQNIALCAGNRQVMVRFLGPHDAAYDAILCLAADVQQQLLLPSKTVLSLSIDDNNPVHWRLGPLIGIFAHRFPKTSRPFGEQSSFFRKLRLAANSQNALCFAFGPEDIDWENKVVRGSIPPLPDDESTGWLTMTLPLPDVVYDRGLFPKGEKRKLATDTRKILRNHPVIKMFNPAFFDKWRTHVLFSKHEFLNQYLPETRVLSNPRDVHELLQKYSCIYLKPSGGSSGKGIIRISKAQDHFLIYYRTNGSVHTREIENRAAFDMQIQEMTKGKRYIVQQGLNLANFNGSPFDIRILMQRNRYGEWLRTGMAARVAKQGCYISNLHAGGHAYRISMILTQVFHNSQIAENIINQIRKSCAQIVSWVTAESSPLFGEIAVDLGVDESGKIWIIELNAIPGRSVFRHTQSMDILAQAISRPMEYARYLSGIAGPANNI